MAKIITNRPEAAAYNGRDGQFVRIVIDGPAFDQNVDQVIVKVDGNELYFFASEVKLSDDERKGADEAHKKAQKEKEDGEKQGKQSFENKKKALKEMSAADGKAATDAQKEAEANPQKPGSRPDLDDDRHRFNRLPSDPPAKPQTDHPPLDPISGPHPSGQPQGERFLEHPLPSGAQMGGASVPPPDRPQPQAPARVAGVDDDGNQGQQRAPGDDRR